MAIYTDLEVFKLSKNHFFRIWWSRVYICY